MVVVGGDGAVCLCVCVGGGGGLGPPVPPNADPLCNGVM